MKNLKIVQNCPKIATLNSYTGPGQCRGQLVMIMVMVIQHLREEITMINHVMMIVIMVMMVVVIVIVMVVVMMLMMELM